MIRTESLSIHYHDRVALRDVSLEMPTGRVTAIVGPSGCGKSSFLNAINRMTDLVPSARVEGRVWIDGFDVRSGKRPPDWLRREVGLIAQKPNPFPLSIRDNIHLGLSEHGMRSRLEREARTEAVLRDVGLYGEVHDRLKRPALELSGGQQQRLCIARALALSPRVLLMDEPCSALDPQSADVIEDLVHELRGRLTIVIVTHNLAQARRVGDELAVFWVQEGAGTLIETGPAARVFSAPQHRCTQDYLDGRRG